MKTINITPSHSGQIHLKSPFSSEVFSHCSLGATGLEGVAVLVSLGLTGRQARVYLALLKAGDARAQVVAGLAVVHRQEVYRLLEGLAQLGLVQQNVSVPTSYGATPLAEGIKLLLEHKASELTVMSEKAAWLTRILDKTKRFAPVAVAPKPCFGVVCEADRGKKYLSAIQETQHTIEAVTSWVRFKKLCFLFETQFTDVLKRGVTVHIVTEKPPNHHFPKWVRTALLKDSGFELKILQGPPAAVITIFDQTSAAIAFNPNTSLTKGPDLWTTNPALTTPCQAYFNTTWAQTKTTANASSKTASILKTQNKLFSDSSF